MSSKGTTNFSVFLLIAILIVGAISFPTPQGILVSFALGLFAFGILFAIASIQSHVEKMHEIMKRDYLKRYPEEAKPKEDITAEK